MVLIRIDPTKILVGGDKKAAETFIGPAKSQLNILKNQMSFQKLSQGIRRVWLNENVYVECKKLFNYQECKIWVRPIEEEVVEEKTTRFFLVVFATSNASEVMVWDLISDTVFIEKTTGEALVDKLAEFDNIKELVPTKYPESNYHRWYINHPDDRHDSPLILPDYLYGWFAQLGYYYTISHLYPATFGFNEYGTLVEWISWNFKYIAESPLPHPNKDVLSDTADQEEDAEQSSYISFFQGSVDTNDNDNADTVALRNEFESLTGFDWPEDTVGVLRLFQYWHPFFWYSNKDTSGDLEVISAEGRGILLYDSWADGEWEINAYGNLELVKDSLIWQTGGIATIETDINDDPLESPEVLLFEYVSVCHKFVDTYGTGMCDTELCEFDRYFRVYEHGRVECKGLVKSVFDLGNIKRIENGVDELVFNSALSISAQRHATDMAARYAQTGSIGDGHTGSDGTLPAERAFDAGYFLWIEDDVENVKNEDTLWAWKITENTGHTSSSSPAEAYMDLVENSVKHWTNMIDGDLSEIGIAVAGVGDGTFIFVQNFGKVDHRYPGFSPFNPENLLNYVDENFVFDPTLEDTRKPKMYLLGSTDLTDAEILRLQE